MALRPSKKQWQKAMAQLSKILLFPIKSLDAIAVEQVGVSSGGALQGDREFALFDQIGKYINAKRYPQIHQIRANYDLAKRLVTLQCPQHSQTETFHLDRDRPSLMEWFSNFFEQPVTIKQNIANGFPDDPDAWGATLISVASLETVANWYPERSLNLIQMRQRFRTNLEIDGVTPFWEDALFSQAGKLVPFQIGEVQFLGTNPCQRCPVPTRDPLTGDIYPSFQKIFTQQRESTLPNNIERSRFNHFYRLAVNTIIPISEAGKVLKLGDTINIK
jgi:hypothetical protein